MTPEQWQRVREVLAEALALQPGDRPAFLERACASDQMLRREVETLLSTSDEVRSSFLESSESRIPITPGAKVDDYEVLRLIGSGGMGEVYRARDRRLGRDVAIKVLPALLSRDPERLRRFEQEAKAAAALNHPNILAVFQMGTYEGAPYLVSELLEGETLREQLKCRPMPLRKAVDYGTQIAHGLAAAHEKGIVHRDLKPENLFVTRDSRIKILDFGLAKLTHREVGTEVSKQTLDTEPGTLLGTAGYMSPEQVRGEELDSRTDIWSFGCVLYEALTGKRPFRGATTAEIVGAVLEREPDWAALPAATPPSLESLLKRCLRKDPSGRLRDIGDARIELEDLLSAPAQKDPPRARRTIAWLTAISTLLLIPLTATLAITLFHWREKPGSVLTARFEFSPPQKVAFRWFDFPVVSPDGSRIAFAGLTPDGQSHLWIRKLDSLSTEMLPGTEDAYSPFWSPDSKFIAFFSFANGKLKTINTSGGLPQILCDAPGGLTGAWNSDGVILFGHVGAGPLQHLAGDGNEPKPITELDLSLHETAHRDAQFLPDRRHFLYFAYTGQRGNGGVYVGSLDSKERKPILTVDSQAAYSPPGFLLYVRGNTLMAQQFNPKRLELVGDGVPLAAQVAISPQPTFRAAFSLSENGVLAYRTRSGGNSELVWFDRHRKRGDIIGPPAEYSNPSLSPDGSRIAVGRVDPEAKSRDLWVFDIKRGTSSRLTFDPADDLCPVWSSDGNRIFFTSDRKGLRDIYVKPASGLGTEAIVLESKKAKTVNDVSFDGRYLVYDTAAGGGPTTQLWILPLFGDRKPFPFVQGKFDARSAQFSPDGHFIAYASSESGRYEVYVQTFPDQHGKWQISTEGGTQPAWRHDGKELFYIGQTKLMAVEVKTESNSFQSNSPKPLFDIPLLLEATENRRDHYVVAPDGQHFLFNAADQTEASMIDVVVNWLAELRK